MKIKEAVQILKDHNTWRRYEGKIEDTPEMQNPKLIGEALDLLIDYWDFIN